MNVQDYKARFGARKARVQGLPSTSLTENSNPANTAPGTGSFVEQSNESMKLFLDIQAQARKAVD